MSCLGASSSSLVCYVPSLITRFLINCLVVITFYALFAAEFIWRYYTDRPVSSFSKNSEASINKPVHFRGVLNRKLSIMLLALVFEAVFLYIR